MPSLDSIRFTTTGYEAKGDVPDGPRVWWTPDGDGVGRYFIANSVRTEIVVK